MDPLVIVLLAGPLIAFATAINFALLNGGDWSLPEIAGVLMLAVVIDATFARIALAAARSGLPF
jgi:hypothetical protein